MRTLSVLAALLALALPAMSQEWPDLSQPAPAVGGGDGDAAVVVGVEDYAFVPDVAGAEANARAWYDYFTRTRGIAAGRVKYLTGMDATGDEMMEASRFAAAKAGPGGTLWFVFIGHGAPSRDGKDGLLVGVDAQQKARYIGKRSVRRGELLEALGKSKAGSIRVILDACFSGRREDGSSIAPGLQPLVNVHLAGPADPRMVVLTAAKADQYAGALPGGHRPAFSYLVLGGLRGWAGKARVTAADLLGYASGALDATLRGRDQTPELTGRGDAVMGPSAGEKGPDLAALAKATAGAGAREEMFRVSNLPAVPRAEVPKALDSAAAGGLGFRDMDVDALGRYDEVFKFDKGDFPAEEKAESWRRLAREAPQFAGMAGKRAADWDRYASQQKAAEEARLKRLEARDSDWEKLSRLLDYSVVPAADKARWSGQFAAAYLKSPGLDPDMARDLALHVPQGPESARLKELAKSAPAAGSGSADARKSGIKWVRIPGGSFMMGSSDGSSDEKPVHRVTVKSFQLAKTEVTFGQYKKCVKAGACAPAHVADGTCYIYDGSSWKQGDLPASFQGDDQPVVCVDWSQAKAFAEWAGGRLPSEAEWEYAARSAGKAREYPWGNELATCARAVMNDGGFGVGCGRNSTWPVCSKTAGNTAQGLCDMAGNVWEWTRDWYHGSYNGAPTDGSAWEDSGSCRVLRGGSWDHGAGNARSANRDYSDPGARSTTPGFRPAR